MHEIILAQALRINGVIGLLPFALCQCHCVIRQLAYSAYRGTSLRARETRESPINAGVQPGVIIEERVASTYFQLYKAKDG